MQTFKLSISILLIYLYLWEELDGIYLNKNIKNDNVFY